MSKEGDRASVFRTTKIRTKLKGDASWLQRGSETQSEPQEEEKPWLAEVRASRLNRAPSESSPVSSPTAKAPPSPIKPIADRAPASGYLIRGVFTKTENKTAPSSTASNGLSGSTTNYTKKPSESYKRIAPHTVRPTSDIPVQTEGQLSPEEQEKRMEAASNVLKTSAVRQRSFVLSAAKKYESTEKSPDTTSSASFVAKRVVILDDSDTPPDATQPTDTPAVPVTPTATAPEPEPQTTVQTSVKTSVDSVNEPAVAPVKDVPPVPSPREEVPPVSLLDDGPAVSVKGVSPVPVKDAPPVSLVDGAPAVSVKGVSPVPVKDTPLVSLLDDAPALSVKVVSPVPVKDALPVSMVDGAPAVSVKGVSPVPVKDTPLVSLLDDAPALSVKVVSPVPVKDALPVSMVDGAPAVSVKGVSPVPVKDTPLVSLLDDAPALSVKVVSPVPVKGAPPVSLLDDAPAVSPQSFELMKPGCTKVATPLPELPAYVGEINTVPDQDVPPVSPVPVSLVSVSPVPEPEQEPEPEPEPELSTNHSSAVDTINALSDTLLSFGTSASSSRDTEPVLTEELRPEDSQAEASSVDDEPAPELSNCIVMTDDLLALTNGPLELEEPIPPSPSSWSQDLLSGPDSTPSNPAQTHETLDLLADDVIPFNTDTRSLSSDQPFREEEDRQGDQTPEDTHSTEENLDPWSSYTRTTPTTESSSTDPFDPYPIGTTSTNSTSDLLEPFSVHSINSPTELSSDSSSDKSSSPDVSFYNVSGDVLDDLADDVIPIDTDTERLSTNRSWERSWDTNTPEYTNTDKSQEDAPEGLVEDQQTLVTFERKSSENDSPWDKWTSPTVYATDTDEEESAENDTETRTVTTVRETYSDPPELAMERAEDKGTQSPDAESKKGCVYIKEYVNTEGRNAMSSPCTYCGELVGNDAKITIEHLNISCHPACFKCGACGKPMGDLLFNMFLHGGTVHCETCYADVL